MNPSCTKERSKRWVATLPLLLSACSLDGTKQEDARSIDFRAPALSKANQPDLGRLVLCHVTDEGTRHNITVAAAAVPAHLGHGDAMGECASGCVSAVECDDANACTTDDCNGDGSCSHAAVECDDSDPCTVDACHSGLGCTTAPASSGACDDGNDCTSSDSCAAGVCTGTPIVGCCRVAADCADDNACTEDTCRSGACSNRPLDCAVADPCIAGFCDPTTGACGTAPVTCDDGDDSTEDSCDTELGCVHRPMDPDGTYTLDVPVSYTCCLGFVNVNVSSFAFAADGAILTSSPTNPVAMTGDVVTPPSGHFRNSGALAGGCTETYTLEGAFTDADSFAATYSLDFVGPQCDCDGFGQPCESQVFVVSASR